MGFVTQSCVCVFQELQLPMLKVSAPELVSGVSGESEQKLRELFDLALVSSTFLLCYHSRPAVSKSFFLDHRTSFGKMLYILHFNGTYKLLIGV